MLITAIFVQFVLCGGTFRVDPDIYLFLLSPASQSRMFDEAVFPIDCLMAAPSQGAS